MRGTSTTIVLVLLLLVLWDNELCFDLQFTVTRSMVHVPHTTAGIVVTDCKTFACAPLPLLLSLVLLMLLLLALLPQPLLVLPLLLLTTPPCCHHCCCYCYASSSTTTPTTTSPPQLCSPRMSGVGCQEPKRKRVVEERASLTQNHQKCCKCQ